MFWLVRENTVGMGGSHFSETGGDTAQLFQSHGLRGLVTLLRVTSKRFPHLALVSRMILRRIAALPKMCELVSPRVGAGLAPALRPHADCLSPGQGQALPLRGSKHDAHLFQPLAVVY